ncbi:hypothetical protein GCM10009663_70600 [Kitasatospora arboriphila]|uniref:Uncharacterized protein n=1 Tax=Kitasatospora arboriphila TaxID=258052 RepID=A0ABN1U594_9ACTN
MLVLVPTLDLLTQTVEEWRKVGHDGPAAAVCSLQDGALFVAGVQAVHLNDALACRPRPARRHCAPAPPAPQPCATADLIPVAALPVEDLAVDLAVGAGLTPLTGHRHLAALAVGATTPIDLAPLRTLPALCALDLSRWPAVGVALLAAVPGLRYPALSPARWTALDAAGRIPARLAGARLAGALDLLAVLGTDTSSAYRRSGTVDGNSWPPGHGKAAGEAGGRGPGLPRLWRRSCRGSAVGRAPAVCGRAGAARPAVPGCHGCPSGRFVNRRVGGAGFIRRGWSCGWWWAW